MTEGNVPRGSRCPEVCAWCLIVVATCQHFVTFTNDLFTLSMLTI